MAIVQPHPRIEMRAVASLRPYSNNARRRSKRQVKQIAGSIERFGFTNPVLVSDEGEIIAGHGRVEEAAGIIDSYKLSMQPHGRQAVDPYLRFVAAAIRSTKYTPEFLSSETDSNLGN